MKKFSAAAVLLLCILLTVMPVSAAGSASLAGPDTVRPGDTITLTFYAGGGIYGGSGSVSFDPAQLTLQGYSAAVGGSWAVEFSGNSFVFYDNSMASPITGSTAIFKATFRVSEGVTPGTNLTVSAGGVTVSDGTADTVLGSRSYSITVAEPLSGNANLKSLTVSNAAISPAFASGTTSYTATVPYTTAKLEVSAVAEHPGAKVSVNSPSLPAGGSAKVTVTVTAENGAQKTYTIRATRQADPNYVPSGENALQQLSVEGFLLSPVFSPEQLNYGVYLPYEVDSLNITAEAKDAKAKVAVGEASGLAVGETVIPITVTAENKDVRTYTVTAFRAQPFGTEWEPESTEATTEPSTESTTEPSTEPSTESTTEPTVEPPAEEAQPTKPEGQIPLWLWPAALVLGLGAGSLLTVLIQKMRR